jgi:hypothetical protein
MRHPTRRRKRSAEKLAELSLAAPQVIAHRTARMLAAGATPSARDSKEFTRMRTEKARAFGESMNAMAIQMVRANQELGAFAIRQWWSAWLAPWRMVPGLGAMAQPLGAPAAQRQLQRSMNKVIASGLGPVHRTATANAKRLGKNGKR